MSQIPFAIRLMCGLGVSCSLIFTVPVYGQDNSRQRSQPALDTTAVCMSALAREVPQVAKAARGQAFRVVVAAQDVPALEEKGFTKVDCGTADLNSRTNKEKWRDKVCEVASFGNDAVQKQLERALGASPAHLCGSARMAVVSD